jgi:hypothetical protein
VLRTDGIYALNVIDYPPLELARAETATLLEAFEHVSLVADPEPGGNLVLLASDRPLPEGTLDAAEFAGDAAPLRDDDAPADQLLTPHA